MGNLLRRRLPESGWKLVNRSLLPIVCFVDTQSPEGTTARFIEEVAARVVASGEAWISGTWLEGRRPALRACITNDRTDEADIDALLKTLDRARASAIASL